MTFKSFPRRQRQDDEPRGIGAASLTEEITRTRRQMMEAAAKTGPITFYNCQICGGQTPMGEPHTCELTQRQQRQLAKDRRKNAAAIAALRPGASRVCPRGCGYVISAGEDHRCSGAVGDKSMQAVASAQVHSMAAALKSAGYKIERD